VPTSPMRCPARLASPRPRSHSSRERACRRAQSADDTLRRGAKHSVGARERAPPYRPQPSSVPFGNQLGSTVRSFLVPLRLVGLSEPPLDSVGASGIGRQTSRAPLWRDRRSSRLLPVGVQIASSRRSYRWPQPAASQSHQQDAAAPNECASEELSKQFFGIRHGQPSSASILRSRAC
jgi:hypothetical protein